MIRNILISTMIISYIGIAILPGDINGRLISIFLAIVNYLVYFGV